MELPADFAVLSVPPEERDAARVNAVAAALAAGNVIDLPFLRSLDTEELTEVLAAAGRPTDDETVRETMEALDTNKDGVLSREEFKSAPRKLEWWESSPEC